jgi:ubiquitin carboxyl-terminal hydrolase 4/11/15
MKKLFDISDDEETRIWHYYSATEFDELTKEDSTVQEVGLFEDQLLVIETRSEDGSWNHPPKKYEP